MIYRVRLAAAAEADIEEIYYRVVSEAPHRGSAWFERLLSAMRSLETFPNRYALARESVRLGRAIRCLPFGRRRHICRILNEVDNATRTVSVLHVRHGARKDFVPPASR